MSTVDDMSRLDRLCAGSLRWGPLVLILFGAMARFVEYARYRVLWLDESYTGVTILDNPYRAFFAPLDHFQIVPPFYLSFARFCAQVLGEHEYALRLPALLAAMAALLLFWRFASALTDRLGATLALAFFATSGMLIYYAAEVKPYAVDVLIAVGLMLLALSTEDKQCTPKRVAALALAGALAVWTSFPSAFVLAGIGGAQAIAALEARDARRFIVVLPAWYLWAASFLLLYFLVVRPGLGATTTHHAQDLDAVMQESWKFGFLPFPPENFGELRWYKEQFARVFYTPGGFGSWVTGLAAFTALLGAWSLALRSRFTVLLVFLPALIALAASLVKLYPFDGRMILFLLPAIYLGIGEGIALLLRHLPRHAALPVGVILLTFLLAPPAARASIDLVRSEERRELDGTMNYIQSNWEDGDRVYLTFYDALVYRVSGYWSDLPEAAVHRERVAYEYQPEDGREIDAYLSGLEAGARVWVPLGFHIRAEDFLTRMNALGVVEEVEGTRPPVYLVRR